MIYKLRQKFIKICILSLVAVLTVLFLSVFAVTSIQTNRSLDRIADLLSSNDGRFPDWKKMDDKPNPPAMPEGLTVETPFTTRFFTVRFDNGGTLLSADMGSIAGVSTEEAVAYARKAIHGSDQRGWIADYRYKAYNTNSGQTVLFISGAEAKLSNRRFMLSTVSVFIVCSVVVIALVVITSQRAVKPVAESYEKQKQFVTDANHELKTPLTLIRTNLDIMESEIGENEWLSDIRVETKVMTELVDRLISLARMDEDGAMPEKDPFSLSDAVLDTVSAFSSHIESSQKTLLVAIQKAVVFYGNEGAIRQLVSVLMDNAVKYCDEGGTISVALRGGKHPVLTVDNSYAEVTQLSLDRVFDRFYRADRARTHGSGFGIGLSIAKEIAQKHHGQIRALKLNNGMIRFQVDL